MKVRVAQICGFCMGVRRAMDLALYAAAHAKKPVYTFGPLIHNPSALELLKSKGIEVLNEIPAQGEGTVIIRAHGVPPEERRALEEAGFEIIDGTCTRVVKVQMLAKHYSSLGYTCVLIGDRGHPEVKGIMGYAGERGVLVSSLEELNNVEIEGKYIVLAQTTRDREEFEEWAATLLKRFPGGTVFNTVCDSTRKRQREVRKLCNSVDAVVVVGGKQSANTKRLAEIAAESGRVSIAVETEEDLDLPALEQFASVGVTAGASTPNWIINRVVSAIEQVPGKGESALSRIGYRLLRFFHETTLWTALAGALLSLSCQLILGASEPDVARAVIIAFLYIFAMHTMNRIIDRESGAFNDPMRSRFLIKHRRIFQTLSLAALLAAVWLALQIGKIPFFLLLALSLLGLIYGVRFIRQRALKDFPGSKTIFTSLAWTVVATLVSSPDRFRAGWEVVVVGAAVFLLVLARSAMMELLDIHGDRIVGRETLAVIMGEERLMALVRGLLVLLALASVAAPLLGAAPAGTIAFSASALWGLYLLWMFKRQRLRQNMRMECMVELLFLALFLGTLAVATLAN